MNWEIATTELTISGSEYNDAMRDKQPVRFLWRLLTGATGATACAPARSRKSSIPTLRPSSPSASLSSPTSRSAGCRRTSTGAPCPPASDGSQDPIPGLYAVGEAAGFGGGGIHGLRSLEGTFLGTCILGGRLAAQVIADGG